MIKKLKILRLLQFICILIIPICILSAVAINDFKQLSLNTTLGVTAVVIVITAFVTYVVTYVMEIKVKHEIEDTLDILLENKVKEISKHFK